VGREVPFVLPLPAASPRVFLHGRLDLLARRGGALVVRDYKYARASAEALARHAPQLGAYRLAVHAVTGGEVEGEILFLRGGPAVRPLPALEPAAEAASLVEAGVALGAARAAGDPEAFARRPPAPEACEALGCGYVRRCWGAPAAANRRAPAPRSGSGAS
jgi:hypothetical protein